MLPVFKDDNQPFQLMQTKWKAELDPVLINNLVQGQLLTGVSLINGITMVPHKLGRKMQGWILSDVNAAATVFRSANLNDTTLTLTSNAACVVSLWVF